MNFEEFKNRIVSKDKRVKDLLKDDDFNFNFEVSHLVTEARIRAGMTQSQLAKAIGTKQPSIARLESGKELPTLPFLRKIAKAIGTELLPPKFEFMNSGPKTVYFTYIGDFIKDNTVCLECDVNTENTSTSTLATGDRVINNQ